MLMMMFSLVLAVVVFVLPLVRVRLVVRMRMRMRMRFVLCRVGGNHDAARKALLGRLDRILEQGPPPLRGGLVSVVVMVAVALLFVRAVVAVRRTQAF